ncbi:MAG: toll/interleukin-1 receptor domain-containing protein [Steroidobacteraceae bacterium]
MSTRSTAILPTATLDEDAWEDLLSYIEERRVIPIVGPELLQVATDRGPRQLYDWVAEKLAARLNVDRSDLPERYTLNDVVCLFLAGRGRREEAYVRLRSVLKDAPFEPPPALRHLAAITDFDLFVTTTFDPLLESAINLERFGGVPSTEVLSYVPNRVVDLPAEREQLSRPVVYHLFGKLSAFPTYVISDEDLLEYICALQNEILVPERLFHELEHNHLLVIGSNLTNWLARLFLRMAKRHRLSDPRDVGEVFADDYTAQDERLVAFLQQVSVRTRIYTGAERFVQELHERWQKRNPTAGSSGPSGLSGPSGFSPARFLPPAREMPDHAVFVSYAREDLPVVQQIKAGLEAAGITTWFDMDRLEAGDDYDRKIQRNITRCSYFIPVISKNTQSRLEGYFRREWSYALDRARNMADGALFILPVSLDDTTAADAHVPERFKALHFTQLPGGHVTPEFAQRLTEFMRTRAR